MDSTTKSRFEESRSRKMQGNLALNKNLLIEINKRISLSLDKTQQSSRKLKMLPQQNLRMLVPIVLLLFGSTLSLSLSSLTSPLQAEAAASDENHRHLLPQQPLSSSSSNVQATILKNSKQLRLPRLVRENDNYSANRRLDKRQAIAVSDSPQHQSGELDDQLTSSSSSASDQYESPMALALDGGSSHSNSNNHNNEARQNHQVSSNTGNPNSSSRGKKTLYACEEKQLQIECQSGESIQLIRANYGRFSIQICNDHGQLDWKVNCMSSSSFDTIERSCQAKQSCQLLASNDIFGDSCPGTPKYLEVHYSCVPAANNSYPRMGGGLQPGTGTGVHLNNMGRPKQQNVIPENNSSPTTTTTVTTATNSETFSFRPLGASSPIAIATGIGIGAAAASTPTIQTNTLDSNAARSQGTQLPPWVMDFGPPTSPFAMGGGGGGESTAATSSATELGPATAATNPTGSPRCPETVMRQIRWPSTEAGQELQRPCPAHAHSGNPNDPYPAVLVCLARGEWAPRVQAARCQSNWLRNLTARVEAGDSPLAILGELVHRTRPANGIGIGATSGGQLATSSLLHNAAMASSQPAVMFGDDIKQIGHIVRQLVEEMGELIQRISDDKQRHGFAKEMVQSLVELVNNLASGHQMDAWLDLAQVQDERQRIAGQLMQNLESATVLLAGAQTMNSYGFDEPTLLPQDINSLEDQASQARMGEQAEQQNNNNNPRHSFLKVTENVYVAIRSLALRPQVINQTLELSLPSKTSTLGTKWMDMEQKFTLHLQATSAIPRPNFNSGAENANGQSAQEHAAAQALKVVFIMVRSLGSQMEPRQQQTGDTINGNRMVVNSNLVSLSIVADSRSKYNPPKVDLSAPIELVFRRSSGSLVASDYATNSRLSSSSSSSSSSTGFSSSLAAADWFSGWFGGGSDATASGELHPPASRVNNRAARCAFWDPSSSDWLTDGCKLVGSNSTHSICACNHLSTFALLTPSNWLKETSLTADGDAEHLDYAPSGNQIQHDQPNQLHHQQDNQKRVQLNSVENELFLQQLGKPLYLAKMLGGNLFEASSSPVQNGSSGNLRLIICGSCLTSAILLAIYLMSSLYHRAHERRLLSAIPSLPPPPLLVTSNSNNFNTLQQQPVATLRDLSNQLRDGNSNNHTNHQLPPFSMINSASSRRQVIDGQSTVDMRQRAANHHQLAADSSPTYSSSDYSATLANTKSKLEHEAFGGSLMQPSNAVLAARTGACNSQNKIRPFQVPIKLIVHLFAIQLLVVLLVESQNYPPRPMVDLHLRPDGSWDFRNQSIRPVDQILPTIGLVTTCLVLALYYFVASFTCWLAAKLVGLNLRLFRLNSLVTGSTKSIHGYQLSSSSTSASSTSSTGGEGSDKLTQYGGATTTSTSTSPNAVATIYGGMRQQQQQHQVYGNGYGQNGQNGQPLGVSPTSSFDSSAAVTAAATAVEQQRIYGRPHLAHLAGNSHLRHLSYSSNHHHKRGNHFTRILGSLCSLSSSSTTCSLLWTIENILPLAITSLIGWLSLKESQAINALAYVTSRSAQLNTWPLLVDCGSTGLAIILYYLPVVCFVLVGLALFIMSQNNHKNFDSHNQDHHRRQLSGGAGASMVNSMAGVTSIVNPYGSSSLVNGTSGNLHNHQQATNREIGASQQVLNKQHQQQNQSSCEVPHLQQAANTNCHWQLDDTKRTRTTCSILLALLALHWICWISFFAHCFQMINLRDPNYYLMYSFAASNLLLVMLLIWSQRKILKRVSQLIGLTRCLQSLGCCCCHFIETTCFNNEMHDSNTCSPNYQSNLGTQQSNRFNNHHLRQNSGSKLTINGGKISPNSQSLFLISQQQQQQQSQLRHYEEQLQQQQQALQQHPNYQYGQQQPPHLYQQISSPQQHIYDSTSALNNLDLQDQNVRFNQMMQQQQQQQQNWHLKQQQQNPFNRSMTSLHHNHHHHYQHHHNQGHNDHFVHQDSHLPAPPLPPPVAHQRQPMTLRPMSNQHHMHHLNHSQTQDMLSLDASGALKQHQMIFRQQAASEQTDGPLVAFSSCGSSASTSSSKPTNDHHFLQSNGSASNDATTSQLATGGNGNMVSPSSSSPPSTAAAQNGSSQQQTADAYRTSAV